MHINIDEAVDQVMRDIDKNEDSHVDVDEFVRAISKWIEEANHSRHSHIARKDSSLTSSDQVMQFIGSFFPLALPKADSWGRTTSRSHKSISRFSLNQLQNICMNLPLKLTLRDSPLHTAGKHRTRSVGGHK